MTDIPLNLNRVGEEVMLALSAESAEGEREHRRLADELMIEIMRDIEQTPERASDWSLLGA